MIILVSLAFPGYVMENDNLDSTDGWSRTSIIIKKSINYKRRKDLERKQISTVWIQVGLPGTKHFLIQALYRQFQRPGISGSKTQPAQEARWTQLIDVWNKTMDEKREILTFGDTKLRLTNMGTLHTRCYQHMTSRNTTCSPNSEMTFYSKEIPK